MIAARDLSIAVSALALCVVALGCTATLRDGAYACPMNTACPQGWYCWGLDHACHATPERPPPDAASVDSHVPLDGGGPPQDAFTSGPTLGTPCTTPATCTAPELCLGPTPANHFCMHSCMSASCTAPEVCIMGGVCLLPGCSPVGSQGTCPPNFVCRNDPMGHPTCFPTGWP